MRRSAGIAVFVCSLVVYAATAYPTVTWWDSSSYSLATATLGVTSPPGSLLLTLIGWPVARLAAPATTAHALNYLAATIAAAAVAMIYLIGLGLMSATDRAGSRTTDRSEVGHVVGAALGAITLAFTTTLWDYAVRFTPYILSALFTTLILAALVAWWRDADSAKSTRWLALLGFLFGLDFSVHRTNALLIPSAVVWILIRRPSTIKDIRAILAGSVALVAGLLVQLLVIPIAAFGHSALDFNDPSNFERFWDYITLKPLGGGFLLQLLPRKSGILAVQSADVLRVLGENFVGWPRAHGALGPLPALLAVAGLATVWRAKPRLGIALASVLMLQIVGTVAYFNIPADYFRSFDRHYLPVCLTVGVLMVTGTAAMCAFLATARRHCAMLAAASLVVLASPIVQIISGWREHDASNRFFAHDWATNSLESLPPDAIYFTFGDNDTFPVMYVQAVEGVRRDVRIINQSIASSPEYVERSRKRDPAFPLSATVTPDSVALHPGDRTVTFAATSSSVGTTNAEPLRLDGLYWRVVADSARAMNLDLTRANILERPRYRGFADPRVLIDDDTRTMAFPYYEAAKALLAEERARGAITQCRADLMRFLAALPLERLALPAAYAASVSSVCDG